MILRFNKIITSHLFRIHVHHEQLHVLDFIYYKHEMRNQSQMYSKQDISFYGLYSCLE